MRTALVFSFLIGPAVHAAATGEQVYRQVCSSCHDRAMFTGMPAERIQRTLETGIMRTMAAALAPEERQAVAKYLGTAIPTAAPKPEAYCRDRKASVKDTAKLAWNGWSATPGNTRYQPAAAAGLTVQQVRGLKLKWAFGFDGDLASFSQPAVFGNQVFAGSSGGVIYALRADSGCIQWTYQAASPVRSAMLVAPLAGSRHALLFGDQTAWFYALDAESGQLLWRKKIEEHPAARVTGSPVMQDGTVYIPVSSWEETFASTPGYACCTFRGSVVALRIRDGEQVWKSYTVPDPPKRSQDDKGIVRWGPSGAGTWAAPTVDPKRGLLYVTTGNNYSLPETSTSDAVLAMDLKSGRIVWSQQVTPRDVFGCQGCVAERGPDFDFGSSAILVDLEAGRQILLAGQKSGVVYALDPDRKGEVLWQTRVAKGTSHGGIQFGMASDGQNVYAPIADGELIRVPNGEGQTRRIMDPNDGGGLAALRLKDGSVAWKAVPARVCGETRGCSPSQLAAATVIPGVVFSGALDGHLRAYSSEDGTVIWDFDTKREFETVNGVKARGGALNGNGPVVVHGLVLVNSGYDHFGSMTGNVLLAFEP